MLLSVLSLFISKVDGQFQVRHVFHHTKTEYDSVISEKAEALIISYLSILVE